MTKGFSEDSRVKIPALITLTSLGFAYRSLKNAAFETRTNILIPSFAKALRTLNPTLRQESLEKALEHIAFILSYDDCGRAFYESLCYGLGGHTIEEVDSIRLIDWDNFSGNSFEVVTELPYGGDESGAESFRPDITLLINGLPLCFIEVKKPNNEQGIQAELKRAKERFSNAAFKRFFHCTQIIVYSNNCAYDESELTPISGAFYSTSYNLKPNHFRDESPQVALPEVDSTTLQAILQDTNAQALLGTREFATNLAPTTPTNSLLISLFAPQRLQTFLRYGIAFVESSSSHQSPTQSPTIEKHIMRYPQFFALCAIKDKLRQWHKAESNSTQIPQPYLLKRGIIWHTQGSGKTALSFYATRWIKDFYQSLGIITKFYFITDRLDLYKQASSEFSKRGLRVKEIESKQDFISELSSLKCNNQEGKDEMIVVNIQKFSQDSLALSNAYGLPFQRVFFIDEAHRSYDPKGSFLTHLFTTDKQAIFLSLTGTPLLGSSAKSKSTQIFGEYIHRYYYDSSIKDGYTLRLIKEDIQASYKEKLRDTLKALELEQGSLDSKAIYAHKSFVTPLYEYIRDDFTQSRAKLGDESIGAMVVCASSEQARELFALSQAISPASPPPRFKQPRI